MSMQQLRANLDADLHKVAQRQAMLAGFAQKHLATMDKTALHLAAQQSRGPEGEIASTVAFLAAEAEAAGVGPTEKELEREENYWLRKFKVNEEREEIRAQKVREYARHRWSLETIMADAGVKARGPMPSTVQKTFTTNDTLVIFPFYWDVNIQAGILASPIIDRLIMADIPVMSGSADHAELTDTDADSGITRGGEGVAPSDAILTATNRTIKLTKLTTAAKATYESLMWARLPIFDRFMMRVGRRLMILITDLGMERLIAGDGDSAAAATLAASGGGVYNDLIDLETEFAMGYEPDIIVAPRQGVRKILKMPEFKDPNAGLNHQMTGRMPNPLGMDLVRWDVTGRATSWATTKLVMGLQGEMMVKYTSGGILTETDRIIRGQWLDTVVTTHTDYGIWDRAACRVGTGW